MSEKQIVFDGQTFNWTNSNNITLKWSGLSKEAIIKNIDNVLSKAETKVAGDVYVAKVAKKNR